MKGRIRASIRDYKGLSVRNMSQEDRDDASLDSSGRAPLGAQRIGRVADFENIALCKNRYDYRTVMPDNLPFCGRCDRESFQCCVPMTLEVRLKLKELTRKEGINIRYMDATPAGAAPLPGGLS